VEEGVEGSLMPFICETGPEGHYTVKSLKEELKSAILVCV